jgi:cytochrome P450
MTLARSFRAVGKILLQLIEQRRKNPAACGGLSLMIQAREPHNGRPMPDQQIIDKIVTLVVAGHETTASTLHCLWYLPSQHPEVEKS